MKGLPRALLLLTLALIAERAALSRPPEYADHHYFVMRYPNYFYASIIWERGRETLRLQPTPVAAANAGWVLALPAPAADVTLSWRESFPIYRGDLTEAVARRRMDELVSVACATQIYPLVFELFQPSLGRSAPTLEPTPPDVLKDGLRFRVRPAGSPAELKREVEANDIDLPPAELDRMGKLADGRHSFLFVSIEAVAVYSAALERDGVFPIRADTGCLELTFPADRVCVPAHAWDSTSPIGGRANIAIEGLALPDEPTGAARHFRGTVRFDPAAAPGIIPYTRAHYEDDGRERWWTQATGSQFVVLDHASGWLKSRLTFVTLVIVWTALCSYVSGGVAGLLMARRWRRFAALGLWNLGTIVALRLRLSSVAWQSVAAMDLGHKRIFIVLFSATFLLLNLLAKAVLAAALGPGAY